MDVLCGTGKESWNHIGNMIFRRLAIHHYPTYAVATCRKGQTVATGAIYNELVRIHGSRFLKKNSATNRWYVAGVKAARDKISHTLRKMKKMQERSLMQTHRATALGMLSCRSEQAPKTKPAVADLLLMQAQPFPSVSDDQRQVIHETSVLMDLAFESTQGPIRCEHEQVNVQQQMLPFWFIQQSRSILKEQSDALLPAAHLFLEMMSQQGQQGQQGSTNDKDARANQEPVAHQTSMAMNQGGSPMPTEMTGSRATLLKSEHSSLGENCTLLKGTCFDDMDITVIDLFEDHELEERLIL
jgi:myosin heavy subunit